MSESASVEVLSAEVRVLQVRNPQLTRSMYWQLDEAVPKQWMEPPGTGRCASCTAPLPSSSQSSRSGWGLWLLAKPVRGQVCHADAATGHQLGRDPDVLRAITGGPGQQWSLMKLFQLPGIHDLLRPADDEHTPAGSLLLINPVYFKRNRRVPECIAKLAARVSSNHYSLGMHQVVQGHDHRWPVSLLHESHATEVVAS
jgi:hypothetical protein